MSPLNRHAAAARLLLCALMLPLIANHAMAVQSAESLPGDPPRVSDVTAARTSLQSANHVGNQSLPVVSSQGESDHGASFGISRHVTIHAPSRFPQVRQSAIDYNSPRQSLRLPDETTVTTTLMRTMAHDAQAHGLIPGGNIEIISVDHDRNMMHVRSSAYANDLNDLPSDLLYMIQDSLVSQADDGAIVTLARTELFVRCKDDDTLLINITSRLHPQFDSFLGAASELNGLLIDYQLSTSLPGLRNSIRSGHSIDIPSSWLDESPVQMTGRIMSQGSAPLIFDPRVTSTSEAMELLGLDCATVKQCIGQCISDNDWAPSPDIVICIVASITVCAPFYAVNVAIGAACSVSYMAVVCWAVSEVFDIVVCAFTNCFFQSTILEVAITSVTPNPAEPNSPIVVTGEVIKSNCETVIDGTVYFSIGGLVPRPTTPVIDGQFMKTIYTPSQTGTYTLVADVYSDTLSGSDSVSVVVDQDSGSPGCSYTLEGTWMVYDTDSETDQWWYKESFRTTDEYVEGLVYVEDLNCDVDVLWQFYRPNGTRYGSDVFTNWTGSPSSPTWHWASRGYLIAGSSMSYTLGRYRAKMFIDSGNGYQLVGDHFYTVGWEYTQGLLARGVNASDPFEPIGVNDIFYQSDNSIYTWIRADNVAQRSDLRCRFYEPDGSLYTEVSTATDVDYEFGEPPGPHTWFGWSKAWAGIGINGYSAANKCGRWTALVDYLHPTTGQWVRLFDDTFRLLESPGVSPNVITSFVPAAPVIGDQIIIQVDAADNTYLDQVVMFWSDTSDGIWHQLTLGSEIMSSSLTGQILWGPFLSESTVEYYIVATDTSGYATPTPIENIVINKLCLSDFDGSSTVNVTDLLELLATWGSCPLDCPTDTNGDGNVNVTDLLSLLAAWGACTAVNDECAAAITIGLGSTTYTTRDASAGGPALPLSCDEGFGVSFGPDIWFVYTPSQSGVLTVSTCSLANYDTRLAAYYGSCGNLSLLACNDDGVGCAEFTSEMQMSVAAGIPINIRLGGYGTNQGSGTITLDMNTAVALGSASTPHALGSDSGKQRDMGTIEKPDSATIPRIRVPFLKN